MSSFEMMESQGTAVASVNDNVALFDQLALAAKEKNEQDPTDTFRFEDGLIWLRDTGLGTRKRVPPWK